MMVVITRSHASPPPPSSFPSLASTPRRKGRGKEEEEGEGDERKMIDGTRREWEWDGTHTRTLWIILDGR